MSGVPEDYNDIKTLGDLLSINYKLVVVKEQLRRNLISLMEKEQTKYPGIIGYDDNVIPALDRAILSGHDIFLIGQIGQAKTKIIETIAQTLLSPIPVIKNSITNDCPMDMPQKELVSILEDKDENHSLKFYVSPESVEKIYDNKLDTKIEWIEGKRRFKYVLATPDISVKDLVGYIDAVKVAKKGVEIYKIESYSPGQLMQAKHIRQAAIHEDGSPRVCPHAGCGWPLQVVNQRRQHGAWDFQAIKVGCTNPDCEGYLRNIDERPSFKSPPVCRVDGRTKYRRVRRGRGEVWQCPK